jgi:hypothetical protein
MDSNELAAAVRLPYLRAGGPMKTTFYSLIIVPPQTPQIRWLHLSRRALLILVTAFLLSFLTTVVLFLTFPRIRVVDADRTRLIAENQALRTENTNIEFQRRKLSERLLRVEETSKRVSVMMTTD